MFAMYSVCIQRDHFALVCEGMRDDNEYRGKSIGRKRTTLIFTTTIILEL